MGFWFETTFYKATDANARVLVFIFLIFMFYNVKSFLPLLKAKKLKVFAHVSIWNVMIELSVTIYELLLSSWETS